MLLIRVFSKGSKLIYIRGSWRLQRVCQLHACIRRYESNNTIGCRPHLNSRQHLYEMMRNIKQIQRLTRREGWWEWRSLWRVQRGFAWPPRISIQGNILHPMINPNQESPHKERIPQDTCINEDLPYKERPSPPRNKCQLYATIKTPKPSQTKVRISYPSFGTPEWWKFFFFVAQVLSRACEDYATYWRFLASSALIPTSLVQEPCIHRIIQKKL